MYKIPNKLLGLGAACKNPEEPLQQSHVKVLQSSLDLQSIKEAFTPKLLNPVHTTHPQNYLDCGSGMHPSIFMLGKSRE